MRSGPTVVLILLGLLLCTTTAAELRVLELRHATAESLLPVVEPLLGPYESVSVYRNALVLNADSAALERITTLVAELDKPLRNLLISVRRAGTSNSTQQGVQISGSVHQGDTTISNTTRSENGVVISGTRDISTRERGGEQSIRALEGTPVLISNGQLVALAGDGFWGRGVEYQEVQQGFRLSARLNGERVLIELSARDDRIENGTVRTGALDSAVSGDLGQWILLGGVASAHSSAGSALGAQHQSAERDSGQLEVRVELID